MDRSARIERIARRLAALLAILAAALIAPGVAAATRPGGHATGHPEQVFTPARLLAVGVGWFGVEAAAWRPMPIRPGPAGRAVLAVGGLGLVATGLGLAIAGRVGLGASYRPSSTRGFTLAPGHRLVTSGAYGLVRHPMYLGLSLAAVGALALFRTWSTLLFVAQVPVLVVRARREDGLLASTYGDAWRRYADRVPFLFPRRPRGGADLALESVPRT